MCSFNRRPFKIDVEGFFVNGVRSLEFSVDPSIFEDGTGAEAEATTNDRFEGLLEFSENTFGKLTQERYDLLVETFITTVLKSCCSSPSA